MGYRSEFITIQGRFEDRFFEMIRRGLIGERAFKKVYRQYSNWMAIKVDGPDPVKMAGETPRTWGRADEFP